MPDNKVYILECNLISQWRTVSMEAFVKRTEELGCAVAALGKKLNEPVYFHDYRSDGGPPPVGGPMIMIECSETFLERVKELPEFGTASEMWEDEPTERSPRIQDYYTPREIYSISPDYSGNIQDVLARNNALGASLLKLARSADERVYFHIYKEDDTGGAPSILLECTDKFIELAKKLSTVNKISPLQNRAETERSREVLDYYSAMETRLFPPKKPRPPGF